MHTSRSIATASSFAFSAIASLPQLLKRDTDMVVSYCAVPYLQRCYTLLVTSNAEHDHAYALKVLHKCCNMDMLGVLLIYLHSPLGALRIVRTYKSNPLLPCYNLLNT